MKVLITGSEGFVGRNLVDMLLKRGGYQVSGLDIRHITPLVDGTSGPDLANEDVALRAIENRVPNVVVHLASSVSTPGSIERPLETFRNTVRTAVHVMEACRRFAVPCIVTSSVKARDAMTPYGASKRMVEIWAEEYRHAYGCAIVLNRPGTIYGPGQEGSPESGWIAWFLKASREGLPVTINGDGSQVRDLLHVEDYCRLLIAQMHDIPTYAKADTIWDVGGGPENAVTVMQMVERLGLAYGFGPWRYGDSERYVGINDVPGWKPTIDWRETEYFE